MNKTLSLTAYTLATFAFLYGSIWYYVSFGAELFNDPNYNILMTFLAIVLSLYVVILSFFITRK